MNIFVRIFSQDSETNEEESAYNEHFKHSELRAGTGVSPNLEKKIKINMKIKIKNKMRIKISSDLQAGTGVSLKRLTAHTYV